MRRSIYFKNFIATALIVLMSFAVLGGLFSAWSYRVVIGERRGAMDRVTQETLDLITSQTRYYRVELDAFEVRLTLSMISRVSGFDIVVADTNRTIVSCSDDELLCPHIGKTADTAIIGNLHVTGTSRGMMLADVYGAERYAVAARIVDEDVHGQYTLGYVFVSMEITQMVDIWRQFLSIFVLTALSVLCVSFALSLVTTKYQAEPINDMVRTARKFAHGDFTARVGEHGREDEIGELAHAFNAMADAMERSENRRRDLIANVSHELKTPMTVIAGFADGILDGTIPTESEAKYLAIISDETRRLSRLVRSLLDVSELTSGEELKPHEATFDIAELIRVTLVGVISKLEAKQLEPVTELPEAPVLVRADKDSMTQVVYNLIDNAVKFSKPGGNLRIALWKQGERAFVSVENEGETISESEMPLIFDRFHKTDKSRAADREGVGLGLYIVKTILDHHNEDIFVTSRDGVTKFTFTLRVAGSLPKNPKRTDGENNAV